MKKYKFKLPILVKCLIFILLFQGCYEFDFVTQPYTADPNSFFEVQISITIDGGEPEGVGYFGILMPDGWATTDSIEYIINNYYIGYIHFSQGLTQQMSLIDPPPENYHWWVGDSYYACPDCTYILDFAIFTDNQTGTFFHDYMLGDDYNGLNYKRSNDHLMIIGNPVGCFPEGITFTDQTEIDNFQVNHPGCTVMAGDVTINGDNITNLDGLDSIASIGGSLRIVDNTNLTILSGLDQLDSIQGTLSVEDNESLLEISGLTHLIYVGLDLRIVNDTLLTSISSTGFENLTAVGRDLFISLNSSLHNLSGLGNLTTIGGNLQIGYYEAGNPALTSLSGLDNVTSIGGYLDIIDNNALISLSGLDSIESASITDLKITNNSSLSTCDVQSICHYLAAPNGFIQIYGNAPGCNSPEEVEEDCNNDCLPDGINFTSQAQIDNFQTNYPGCPEIEGNVTIQGSDITNLNGLNVLTSIGGYLAIIDNNALTGLGGLDNLTFIWGNLDISGNGVLTSLSGLDNLTSIWGYLDISGNGVLTSLSGLDNIADASITDLTITNNSSLSTCEVQSICHYLAAPNGFIQIYGNAFGCNSQEEVEEACSMYCLPQGITFTTQAQIDNFQTNYSGCIEIEGNVTIQGSNITNLNGLNVLTSIGGYLDIIDNDALISLSGLDNLTYIGGYLDISGNGVLTSLSGLDNLTSIGGALLIGDNESGYGGNPALTSLSGLDNLTSIVGVLTIYDNDALISLSGLDNLTSIGGYLDISGNGVLTSLSMMDNLIYIGGNLNITYNDALISLSGPDNLTSIVGHLGISHNNALISLSGLDNLTSIGGNLTIYDNDALISLSGLDNLTSIEGNVSIGRNNDLISLNGLDNLTSIGGSLQIGGDWASGNPVLTSLSGLDNIEAASITDLNIKNNSSLSNCEVQSICDYLAAPNGYIHIYGNAFGCNSLEEVEEDCNNDCLPDGITFTSQAQIDNFQANYPGCPEIEGNVTIQGSDITNLNGLNVLTSIWGYLDISGNGILTSLSGLDNLTYIGGYLDIIDNDALISLSGLDNLTYIWGHLDISGNGVLTSLSGLDNIANASITGLTITDNSSLSTCHVQSICHFLAAPNGFIQIYSNAFGCNSQEEVVEACSMYCLPQGITFTTQAQIDNFQTNYPGCTEVEGDVTINGTDITNLNRLIVLTSIAGNLKIGNLGGGNPNLTSLSGLENLISIGRDLIIRSNDALTSLSGLENLTYIGGDLGIYDNGVLTNLSGLENLTYIGEYLDIIDNNALSSLTGLENLTYIGRVIEIIGNDALISLSGLDNLSSIGGNLVISDNNALISLSGLDNLTSIGGYLEISGNGVLTSLSGLDNIEAASITDLFIYWNSALSTCEVQSICEYLVPPHGTIEIHNNATGCNSQAEVITACEGVGIQEEPAEYNHNRNVNIFPNPGSGSITVEFEMREVAYVTVAIFNLTGQQVAEPVYELKNQGQQQVEFDVSGLPPGVFYCRLQAGNETIMKKFVKVK